MRKLLVAIVFAACSGRPDVVVIPTVAYPFNDAVLLRGDVQSCAATIERLSNERFERAAFLLLRADGRFDCRVWQAQLHADRAEWGGPPPDGTVAIIHSHPRDFPEPSDHDRREAVRIGVPILVVTRAGITMAPPRMSGGGVRLAATAR